MLPYRYNSRYGTFILFIVGVASAITLIAAAFFLSSTRSRLTSGSLMTHTFAQQAAQLAVSQAIYLIKRDFLSIAKTEATAGGVVIHGRITNLDQQWRTTWFPDQKTGFPIHDSGQAPRPGGLEGHKYDEYERFTPASDYLTQFYARVYDYRVGTYDYRANIYFAGFLNTPGVGRFFPWRTDSSGMKEQYEDPAGRDTSAMWFDSAMQLLPNAHDPTHDDYKKRRYLLRYTANVEDLSGHLLSSCTRWDGTYDATTAARYERAVFTMGKFMRRYPSAECMRRFWMLEPVNKAMMNIWVYDNWKDDSPEFNNIFNSKDPMTRDGEIVLSWEPYEKVDPSNNGSEVPFGAYVLTPFGAIAEPLCHNITSESTKPWLQLSSKHHHVDLDKISSDLNNLPNNLPPHVSRLLEEEIKDRYWHRWFKGRYRGEKNEGNYYDIYDDNCQSVTPPWIVNLPTAVAPTIGLMLMAALPKEFHEQVPGALPRMMSDPLEALGEWHQYESSASYFMHDQGYIKASSVYKIVAGSSYPGCSSSPEKWSKQLGKLIDVNEPERWWYNGFDVAPMSPLHGQWGALYNPLWWDKANPGETGWLQYGHQFNKPGANMWKQGGYLNEHSFYMDIAQALVNTVAYVQARWSEKLFELKDSYKPYGEHDEKDQRPYESFLIEHVPTDKDKIGDDDFFPDTLQDVDEIFLAHLGIKIDDPSSTQIPSVPCVRKQGRFALQLPYNDTWAYGKVEYGQWQPAYNIAKLKAENKIDATQANLMERVLNDFRMSFFGASPQYENFRFLDFTGPESSGQRLIYASDGERSDVHNQPTELPAQPDLGAFARKPKKYWSLSGYFVFQKSRFYRIFARGEVFDTYRRVAVAQSDLEAVVAIDRAGEYWDVNNRQVFYKRRDPITKEEVELIPDPKVEILYQRWHDNRYKMNLPRTYP